jgi:opacity protein-like surface antigen
MGRIHALLIAGLATTGLAGTAFAADILPPAPPLDPPSLRGSLADDSGFYMRADIGVGATTVDRLNSTFRSGDTLASLGMVEGPASLGDPFILGVGLGYQFNAWLRADLTGEYRNGVDYRASSTYQFVGAANCPTGGGVFCGDDYSGTVKSGLFLANGYLDIGNWHGFTPYVGGGVGLVAWQTTGVRDMSLVPPNAFGYARNASGTNFAWALTAGVGYRILPNLLIDLSYRYVNMGGFKTGTIACNSVPDCHGESQSFNVASNDLRVGLRWLATEPAAPPPVRVRY